MRPQTPEEAAALLRDCKSDVRPVGGATKLDWGGSGAAATDLETGGLNRILEHNTGDFTAVLEAGVRLADAQAAFGEAGQMFAIDPPLGAADGATIGGVLATNDSGPLRHRYGGMRDLVVGINVALSDGTLAKAGGKVIKNVAGYDLAKLFTGSFGTLGLVTAVSLRLHPRQEQSATVAGASDDPSKLADVAGRLAALPLEADCLDVAWQDGSGRVLVRFAGATAASQAAATAERLREARLDEVGVDEDDDGTWSAQRAAQRSQGGAVLKVSARTTDLATAMRTADEHGGALVGRAALGLLWLRLEGDRVAERVTAAREALAPRACLLLDAPADVRAAVGPWPPVDPGALAVMERLKARFDPTRIFRPGAYVGGI